MMYIRLVICAILFCCSVNVYAEGNALLRVFARTLPDDKMRVQFQFTKPLAATPLRFMTEKPPRLVIDFPNTEDKLGGQPRTVSLGIGALRGYQVVTAKGRVRVVLDLSRFVAHSAQVRDNVYILTLSGPGTPLFEQRQPLAVTHRPIKARYTLTHLGFRGTGHNDGRVILTLSAAGVPSEVTQSGRDVLAILHHTKLLKGLMKQYDVADFQSPAKFLKLHQVGDNVHLKIRNKGPYGYVAYQINKRFLINIFALSDEAKKQAQLKNHVYTGKLISLNFQRIPVRAILQLLAEFTGMNIVVSDDVKGNMTLKLDNIPWDQAFDIILQSNALDKRRTGNVVMVAPKATLLQQEKVDLQSQQAVSALAPLRSELVQINYAKAADIAGLLKDKNMPLLSKRGALSVDTRTNSIWIQDTSTRLEDIRNLVSQWDVPVRQVLIEARIVDVTKDFARDLGIRFGVSKPPHLSGTLEGANQLAQGVAPANVTPLADRLNVDLGAAPVLGNPASIGIALAKLGDGVLLDLELSALESEGRGEVIASPRLITTNQQPALIESGEEIPYQESTSSGATSVAFKKAVLSLKVTPQITPDNKIMMALQINQDRPSEKTFNGVPAIITKEIRTNVLVDNGQTIVLGGIYKKDKASNVNRVPFLGGLPVVGILFRNEHLTSTNEELLIFITPKIITNTVKVTAIEGAPRVVTPPVATQHPWKQ